jgi:PTH1 family peptidyl-tRNA hydrolase
MQAKGRRVIVGLGNPGREYERTRHNIGRMVVRKLAERHGASFKKSASFEALHAWCEIDGREVDLLLPETYMNDSGRAVSKFLRYLKLDVENLIVVVDDIAISFGALRVRAKGSHGGHNGLKSIEASLGTRDYPRLRLGIGESQYEDLVDHVLGRFSDEELKTLPSFIEGGAMCLERLIIECSPEMANREEK